MTDFDEICAECKALHKDHYTDENGNTVSNCDTCPVAIYEDDVE